MNDAVGDVVSALRVEPTNRVSDEVVVETFLYVQIAAMIRLQLHAESTRRRRDMRYGMVTAELLSRTIIFPGLYR